MCSAVHRSLETLSRPLLDTLLSAERVILLANNPAITQADITGLGIGAGDVVISFNKCLHLRHLKRRHTSVFIHRHNYRKGGYFGFPYKWRQRLFHLLNSRTYSVLLGGDAWDSGLCRSGISFLPLRQAFPALREYPYDELPTRGGPTTGFYVMAFCDYLKQARDARFEILMVGFSDEGGGSFWEGHAWDYEREWIKRSSLRVVKPG